MDAPNLVFAVAAVLFFYVVLRVMDAIHDAYVVNRRWAQTGVVFAVAAPLTAALPAAWLDLPDNDLRALLIGSALWVTLALAFAAFVLSRLPPNQLGR